MPSRMLDARPGSMPEGAARRRRGTAELRRWAWLAACVLASGCCLIPSGPTTAPETGPTTPDFLADAAFDGTYTPRGGNATTGGEATYHGRILFTNLARTVVDDVLPGNLRLAPNVSSAPSLHPVVVLLGDQTQTRWVIFGAEAPVGEQYQEAILLVPFVVRSGSTLWHNYVVRMYLDDVPAQIIGNQYYGYAKRQGTFEDSAAHFLTRALGTVVHRADFTSAGTWMSAADAAQSLPNFLAMRTIFEMPVLGRLENLANALVCSYFEWNFAPSMVRSVVATHRFEPGFAPNMSAWVAQGTLASLPAGTFEVKDLEWRVAFPPHACQF